MINIIIIMYTITDIEYIKIKVYCAIWILLYVQVEIEITPGSHASESASRFHFYSIVYLLLLYNQ